MQRLTWWLMALWQAANYMDIKGLLGPVIEDDCKSHEEHVSSLRLFFSSFPHIVHAHVSAVLQPELRRKSRNFSRSRPSSKRKNERTTFRFLSRSCCCLNIILSVNSPPRRQTEMEGACGHGIVRVLETVSRLESPARSTATIRIHSASSLERGDMCQCCSKVAVSQCCSGLGRTTAHGIAVGMANAEENGHRHVEFLNERHVQLSHTRQPRADQLLVAANFFRS